MKKPDKFLKVVGIVVICFGVLVVLNGRASGYERGAVLVAEPTTQQCFAIKEGFMLNAHDVVGADTTWSTHMIPFSFPVWLSDFERLGLGFDGYTGWEPFYQHEIVYFKYVPYKRYDINSGSLRLHGSIG